MKRSRMLKISFRVLMAAFFILVAISPLTVSAAGTTYYVDNTNVSCSDAGSGTLAVPFCTISKGASVAIVPGDTVHVLHGTYAETVYPHAGIAGSPITFQADPGVTVTGDSAGFGSGFAVSLVSYVVIDGFTITETKYKGIYVDSASYITITHNHVTYAGKDQGYDQHQQGIFIRNTTNSTISNNITDHNSCIGIRLINNSDYNTVSNNISFANASIIAWPDVAVSDAAGIELTGSSHNTVIHNITYGNEDTGINMYENSSLVASSYNMIVGNLSYGNGDHGIDNHDSPYNTIVGNTVHGNGTVGINFEGDTGSHHATVANNISAGNGLNPPSGSFDGNLRVDAQSVTGTTLDYDLFDLEGAPNQIIWNDTSYPNLTAFKAAVSQEGHGVEGNPLFASPITPVSRDGNPFNGSTVTGDYHLGIGSPAIDSANSDASGEPLTDLDGNDRVDDPLTTPNTGAGTRDYDDRGAYEYQPAGTEPTVTTQAVTDIGYTSATGHGNVTDLGSPNPLQHGVVWSTSSNPTTSDSKTEEGSVSATGAFTSVMSGLMPGTHYHVRAYASNTAGTAYGGDVEFDTLPATTNSETFTTSGTWIAPAGVTLVTVEVWGGGGRGGSISGSFGEATRGGGGGGAYSIKANIPVTPGGSYDYVVGSGSTGTSAGGDSYFISPAIVLAKGGNSVNTSNTGASGGSSASGVGDTKYAGGTGADGNGTSDYSGGGGSSAGTGANGANATNATGATAPTGGGSGGNGRSSTSGNGSSGSAPGGGGGGAYRSSFSSSSYNGGSGASGQVKITYYSIPKTDTTTSVNCGAGTPVVTYGNGISCVATVTRVSGSLTPSGNVNWTTDGSGAFVTTPCTLSGSGGSATCSVTYTPSDVGTGLHKITATYGGDIHFAGSSGNQDVTVNTAVLVPSITADNKEYDGTTAAAILTRNVTPILGTDDVTLTGGTATFSNANIGTGKTVTGSGFTLGGGDATNYHLSPATASTTANITAKALTVTGITADNKVYNGTTAATLNLGGATLVGKVDAEDVTLNTTSAAGAFADKNVGTGKTVTISGLSLDGTAKGNYTLTQPTATADITAKALSVTAAGVNKEYDGTTTAAVNLSDDRVSGDVLVLSYSAASFDTKDIGTGKTVSVTGINVTGADSGNYTFNTSTSTTADITAKALTVTGITANNKVYDATANASLNLGSAALVGVVVSEDVTIDTGSATGTFDNKNVGTGKTVTVAGVGITGADIGNYTVTQPTATANITKAALLVTATGINKVYDGTTVATVTLTDTRFAGDVLSLSYTAASFTDKDVGTGKLVNVTGINVTGTDAGNYTWNTTAITSANITKAVLTVSATGVNKTYDGTTAATVTLTDTRFAGDVLALSYAAASFDTKDVGTGKAVSVTGINVTGTDSGNYTWNTTASTTANITLRAMIVTATGHNKEYDGTTTATVTLSDTRITGDVLTFTYTANFDDKNVGTGKAVSVTAINATGADAGNYDWNTTTSTTADVTQAVLTVSAIGINKEYDGTTDATVTLTDTRFAGDVLSLSYSSASFDTKDVGTGITVTVTGINVTGTDSGNYTWNTETSTTADITKAALTVSATGVNKTYDGTTAASVTLSDNHFGSDVLVLGYGAASFDTKDVGTGKTVSVTGIVVTGADAGNYTWNTTTSTTANISKAALSVSATGINKVYDATTAAEVDLSHNGIVTDSLVLSYTVASFSNKTVGTGKYVGVTGINVTGTDAGNYTWNTTASTLADITKAALTVGATGVNKTYDGTTAATVTLTDTRFAGDVLALSYAAASFDTKDVGTGKTVSVTGINVTGTDSGNYTWNTTTSTTADITKKALAVTATGENKVYNGNTVATVELSDDRISGDVLSLTYTANFDNKNVGTGKAVSVTAINATGADAGNYDWNTTTSTTADITQAALAVSATGVNKEYDGNTDATVNLLDDRISGDVLSLSYTAASFATKDVGTGITVTVTGINVTGTDSGNYTWNTETSTTADITPKELTVTGVTADNKVYDGTITATIDASIVVLHGVILSEDVSLDTTGATGVFEDANAGTGKTVFVSGIVTTGADKGNYSLTQPTTTADITKATPTLSVTNSPIIATGVPVPVEIGKSVPGTVSDIKYNGSSIIPTEPGIYAITADFTPDDATNYESLDDASAGDFVIHFGVYLPLAMK